jgi:hypothetical protein
MDNITKAKVNLFAVLRNLEDLCELDPVSKDLIKDVKPITLIFTVPEVGSASIAFKDGKCAFSRGKAKFSSSNLHLWFNSAEHFNKLINGEKTIPIFINIFKAGFLLKQFTKLTDRMSYYLQPKPEEKEELLKNPDYFTINTTLTAYTAFFAMSEIANSDYVGKACAKRTQDGVILVEIGGGPSATVTVQNHKFSSAKGGAEQPKALMKFSSMQFAHDLLNGQASSFGGMGSGDFAVHGAVDMLEQMSKLLNVVSEYLG